MVADLICVKCNKAHTAIEAANNSMSCLSCGGALKRALSATNALPLTETMRSNSMVAELSLPAHNESDVQAVAQFIKSLPLPISLEYCAVGTRRSMLVRGPEGVLRIVASRITSAWPQASLRILSPSEDPLASKAVGSNYARYDTTFVLASAQYLPLRNWESYLSGDPVHGILSSLMGVNQDERVWLQVLVASKGEPPWLRDVQRRLKTESQRGFLTNPDAALVTPDAIGTMPVYANSMRTGLIYVAFMIPLAFMAIAAIIANPLWWLGVVAMLIGFVFVSSLFSRTSNDEWYNADLRIISQKIVQQSGGFQRVMIRAAVWAPSAPRANELMRNLYAGLEQYSAAGGNRLVPVTNVYPDQKPWPMDTGDDDIYFQWLSPDETSSLWHPPIVNETISPGLMSVRGAAYRAPDPEDVVGFYKIGESLLPDGGKLPVHVSVETLRKNTFLIGKTGAGKSTLQEHLALAALQDPEMPAVVVIDPHGDMVSRLMGAIPPGMRDRVRVLDVGDEEFVYSYNPLDVHTHGLSPDQAAQLIIDIGQSLWSDFWGPRMQNPLKRAVQALAAANELRPPGDALGLSLMNSVLSAVPEIRKRFLDGEIGQHPLFAIVGRYFNGEFKTLSSTMREQIIQPVISKGARFEEHPMLALFSPNQSMLDPGEIIRERRILLVNTRMSRYGSEMSDFVGSLIINAMIREISRQGEKSADGRVPVVVAVDEFQTFTGVPWQELIAQLRKWGARAILGTQSLASIKATDAQLVGVIMSGVYNIFALLMNGEDAAYMSENELSVADGGPSATTLTSLDPYTAFARLVRPDGRVTRPFSFVTETPAPVDKALADAVWQARAGYSARLADVSATALRRLTYIDDTYGGTLVSGGSANFVSPATRRGRGRGVGREPGRESLAEQILTGGGVNSDVPDRAGLYVSLENLGMPELLDDEIYGQPLYPVGEEDEDETPDAATIASMRVEPLVPGFDVDADGVDPIAQAIEDELLKGFGEFDSDDEDTP